MRSRSVNESALSPVGNITSSVDSTSPHIGAFPSAPVKCSPELPQLSVIGRYEIGRLLGSGGFGDVYLARDPLLDRPVAVKVSKFSKSWTAAEREEFVNEARLTAKVKHPNVVVVYDVGIHDQSGVFVCMEYVEGTSLAAFLKTHGPIEWRQACELIAQAADAIHAAHKLGILHRDLKPGNLLLDATQSIKVADFGLAVIEEHQPKLQGQVSGSPSYMSPEQLRGDVHLMDGRCDIWGLGATLYECLTGARPFKGGDFAAIRAAVLTQEPRPIGQRVDGIPERVSQICLQCLSKSVEDRPATALELAVELRAQLKLNSGSTDVQTTPAQTNRASFLLVLISTVCLLVVASLGWTAWILSPVSSKVTAATMSANIAPMPLPQGNFDTLAQLRPIVFDASNHADFFGIDPQTRHAVLSTQFWTLLALSEPQARQFQLAMITTCEDESKSQGLCWNRQRKTSLKDRWVESCECVYIDRHFKLGWQLVHLQMDLQGPNQQDLQPSSIRVIKSYPIAWDSSRSLTLSLELLRNQPSTVTVGDEIIELTSFQAEEFNRFDSPALIFRSGKFEIHSVSYKVLKADL